MGEIKVITREYQPEDLNFIMSTWLRGQYYGHPFFESIPPDIFYKKYAERIKKILPNSHIKIACDESSQSWIVGYAVFGEKLHWVHVKKDFRQKGIARLLTKGYEFVYTTSITKKGILISNKLGLLFDPL